MNNAELLPKITYERYRLVWMLSHQYSLSDLVRELEVMRKETPDSSISELFAEWEFNRGFYSEIWPSYDEFVETEYLDRPLMFTVLPTNKFSAYCEWYNANGIGEAKVIEKIIEIAEELNFRFHEYREDDVVCGYEMEGWTPAGVNMVHFIDCRDDGVNPRTLYEELDKIMRDFDVDEQIDLHRQDKRFAQDFTIRQSLEDFEIYDRQLTDFCKKAMEVLETYF